MQKLASLFTGVNVKSAEITFRVYCYGGGLICRNGKLLRLEDIVLSIRAPLTPAIQK